MTWGTYPVAHVVASVEHATGNFVAWTPIAGAYTLTETPSADERKGNPGVR